ncbi:MAG: glycosyltransferase [Pseudomonadota bacterium]|nr:glycosyltransferase [Pseudomonadota bacterium]
MHLVDTTLFYSPTSGGVRRYLNAKHAWYLRQAQVTHSLLVPGDDTQARRGDVSTLAGHVVPGTFNYRLPLSPRRWKRMLHELAPDLIEAGDAFHPAWCALDVARARRIPAVAFFHSHLPRLIRIRLGDGMGRMAGRYLRWLYSRFDQVLAPSRVMCDYLRGIGLTNVSLQPLGVDTVTFNPARRGEQLRRKLGLADGTRLLVYAGRFSAEKNIPVLHETFARLGDKYHLLLVGGGEYLRPASNITRVPYHRDSAELATTLASADALVHAGTAETFGLVVLEAMACGRPVVGIRANAVAELVDESVGITAARAEASLLARAVGDLYDRDIEALGRAARQRVETHYSWDSALRHQLAIYDGLVEKKRTLPAGWATARRRPSADQQALPAGPSRS